MHEKIREAAGGIKIEFINGGSVSDRKSPKSLQFSFIGKILLANISLANKSYFWVGSLVNIVNLCEALLSKGYMHGKVNWEFFSSAVPCTSREDIMMLTISSCTAMGTLLGKILIDS